MPAALPLLFSLRTVVLMLLLLAADCRTSRCACEQPSGAFCFPPPTMPVQANSYDWGAATHFDATSRSIKAHTPGHKKKHRTHPRARTQKKTRRVEKNANTKKKTHEEEEREKKKMVPSRSRGARAPSHKQQQQQCTSCTCTKSATNWKHQAKHAHRNQDHAVGLLGQGQHGEVEPQLRLAVDCPKKTMCAHSDK